MSMLRALECARQALALDEVPVGAVIYKDGIEIASAYNLRESQQNPLAHAECLAIQEAAKKLGSWRLIGCQMYVTLEPCPMCLAALQQSRIEKIIYGAKDPKGGALSLGYLLHQDERMNHRFIVSDQLNDECSLLLSDFFKSRRKPYKTS